MFRDRIDQGQGVDVARSRLLRSGTAMHGYHNSTSRGVHRNRQEPLRVSCVTVTARTRFTCPEASHTKYSRLERQTVAQDQPGQPGHQANQANQAKSFRTGVGVRRRKLHDFAPVSHTWVSQCHSEISSTAVAWRETLPFASASHTRMCVFQAALRSPRTNGTLVAFGQRNAKRELHQDCNPGRPAR